MIRTSSSPSRQPPNNIRSPDVSSPLKRRLFADLEDPKTSQPATKQKIEETPETKSSADSPSQACYDHLGTVLQSFGEKFKCSKNPGSAVVKGEHFRVCSSSLTAIRGVRLALQEFEEMDLLSLMSAMKGNEILLIIFIKNPAGLLEIKLKSEFSRKKVAEKLAESEKDVAYDQLKDTITQCCGNLTFALNRGSNMNEPGYQLLVEGTNEPYAEKDFHNDFFIKQRGIIQGNLNVIRSILDKFQGAGFLCSLETKGRKPVLLISIKAPSYPLPEPLKGAFAARMKSKPQKRLRNHDQENA